MIRSVRDLFQSLFRRAPAPVETYTPAPAPKLIYLGFNRWRNNPNWPGRRAAAARRHSGTTRRMR